MRTGGRLGGESADFGFDRSTGRTRGSDPPARQDDDESYGMRVDDRYFLQAVTFWTSRSPHRVRQQEGSATALEDTWYIHTVHGNVQSTQYYIRIFSSQHFP